MLFEGLVLHLPVAMARSALNCVRAVCAPLWRLSSATPESAPAGGK